MPKPPRDDAHTLLAHVNLQAAAAAAAATAAAAAAAAAAATHLVFLLKHNLVAVCTAARRAL